MKQKKVLTDVPEEADGVFFFFLKEIKKKLVNGEDWFTDTHMILIMYICVLMVCVDACVQTDLLPLDDHWTVTPVLLLMEITGGWGPPPRRHTDLTPPPSPFSTWTRPPPRDYKKSAPAEVVQSRPELHQVREATLRYSQNRIGSRRGLSVGELFVRTKLINKGKKKKLLEVKFLILTFCIFYFIRYNFGIVLFSLR